MAHQQDAGVAELADALDSGSSGPQGHGGSSPLTRTIHKVPQSLDFQGFFLFLRVLINDGGIKSMCSVLGGWCQIGAKNL